MTLTKLMYGGTLWVKEIKRKITAIKVRQLTLRYSCLRVDSLYFRWLQLIFTPVKSHLINVKIFHTLGTGCNADCTKPSLWNKL